MHLICLDPKDLVRSARNPGKQLGEIVRVQSIQGASQTVIFKHLGSDPWSQQVLDGFVGEELRHQIPRDAQRVTNPQRAESNQDQ